MSKRPTAEEIDEELTPRLLQLRRDPRPHAWEVPDGWAFIVADLDRDLEQHAFWFRYSALRAERGVLRIHLDYAADIPAGVRQRIQEITVRARERSLVTCQDCGDAGTQRKHAGGLGVWCDMCFGESGA